MSEVCKWFVLMVTIAALEGAAIAIIIAFGEAKIVRARERQRAAHIKRLLAMQDEARQRADDERQMRVLAMLPPQLADMERQRLAQQMINQPMNQPPPWVDDLLVPVQHEILGRSVVWRGGKMRASGAMRSGEWQGMFAGEINPEHLSEEPESLIPLTDLIADLGGGDGERIAFWLSHEPLKEQIFTDEWSSWATPKYREL